MYVVRQAGRQGGSSAHADGWRQVDLKLMDMAEPQAHTDEVLRSSEGSDPSEYLSQSPEHFSESCPSDVQLIDRDPVELDVDGMGHLVPHGEERIETSFWDTLMTQE